MIRKLGALTWKDTTSTECVNGDHVLVMRRRYFVADRDVTTLVQGMIDKRMILEPAIQNMLDDWED